MNVLERFQIKSWKDVQMDNSITFIIRCFFLFLPPSPLVCSARVAKLLSAGEAKNCLGAGQIFFLALFEYDSAHPKKNPGYASENLSSFFWDTLQKWKMCSNKYLNLTNELIQKTILQYFDQFSICNIIYVQKNFRHERVRFNYVIFIIISFKLEIKKNIDSTLNLKL